MCHSEKLSSTKGGNVWVFSHLKYFISFDKTTIHTTTTPYFGLNEKCVPSEQIGSFNNSHIFQSNSDVITSPLPDVRGSITTQPLHNGSVDARDNSLADWRNKSWFHKLVEH